MLSVFARVNIQLNSINFYFDSDFYGSFNKIIDIKHYRIEIKINIDKFK